MRTPRAQNDLIEHLRRDARRLPGPSATLGPEALASVRAVVRERAQLPAAGRPRLRRAPERSPARTTGAWLAAAAAAVALAWIALRPGPADGARVAAPVAAAHELVERLPDVGARWTAYVEQPLRDMRDEVQRLQQHATTTGSFLAQQLFTPLRALRLTPQLHDPEPGTR